MDGGAAQQESNYERKDFTMPNFVVLMNFYQLI